MAEYGTKAIGEKDNIVLKGIFDSYMININTGNIKLMNNQSGMSLLEFMFVLTLTSAIALLTIQSDNKASERAKGSNIGSEIVKYNNSVTSYISYNVTRDRYHQGTPVEYEGVGWLKDSSCSLSSNPEDISFISCNFEDNLKGTSFNFKTTIFDEGVRNSLKAISYVDMKYLDSSGELKTYYSEDILGLAAMSAIGNNYSDGIVVDPDALDPVVDGSTMLSSIVLANTGVSYYYCPLHLPDSLLNDNCTKDGVNKEGGMLVMVSSTDAENDSWLRTDGSNDMKNSINLSSTNDDERKIEGVDRIYNLAGDFLKLGNSGVFQDNGSWETYTGDGVVLDTDIYMISSLKIDQDAEFDSNLSIANDLFSQGNTYFDKNVVVDKAIEVTGDLAIAGDTTQGGNKNIAGELLAETIDINSIIRTEEVNIAGSLYANNSLSATIVNASDNLVSEGDLSVRGDFLTKNMFSEGDVVTVGNILANGDVIAQTGSSYLGEVYTNQVTDGDFTLNPSGSSRLNTVRSAKLMGNTNELNLRGEKILLAADSANCNEASSACASNVEGYLDLTNVNIKSPDGGSWVGMMEFLSGMEDYISDVDSNINELGTVLTSETPQAQEGWECNGSTKGVRLGETNALKGQSKYGWSCEYQDNFVIDDVYDNEALYICAIDCSASSYSSEPSDANCVAPGYLDEKAISNDPSKEPSDWECTVKETIGSENIYECSIPCRLPPPPCPDGNLVDQGWYDTCEVKDIQSWQIKNSEYLHTGVTLDNGRGTIKPHSPTVNIGDSCSVTGDMMYYDVGAYALYPRPGSGGPFDSVVIYEIGKSAECK
jgi:cytoskeletal protein CcmA (bactofilin family)